MGLGNNIVENIDASNQDHAKSMIFLCHHLDERLKREYLIVMNTLDFRNYLKERFEHLKMVVLPKAQYDWFHLWLQNFIFVNDYNLIMFRMTSQSKLYGENMTHENMLEKTYSAFHVSNILL